MGKASYSLGPVTLLRKKATERWPKRSGKAGCTVDATYLEAVGSFPPEVEQRVNARLHPLPWATRCDDGLESSWGETVHGNGWGILSVEYYGFQSPPGTGPEDSPPPDPAPSVEPQMTDGVVNVAVPAGTPLTTSDFFVAGKLAELQEFLKPYIVRWLRSVTSSDPVGEAEMLSGYFGPEAFTVAFQPDGLWITSWGVPRAYRELSREGLSIPYADLAAAGLLNQAGPLRALLAARKPPLR